MEVVINGIKTNYQVFGEGEPFLILHGWGSNSDRWANVADLISKGVPGGPGPFKVIVPDLPGFGKTDVLSAPWDTNKYINFIEQFIKELNIGEFYLFGHSFGGALTAKIAVKHVQDVKKLFLVSAACVREKTAKKNVYKRGAKFIKLFKFLPYYALFRKAVYKYIIRRSDYIYFEGVMKETYLKVVAEDVSFQLPFIKVPTVIIWGDKDDSTPIEDAKVINEKIKNSRLVIIPGAGHRLNKENAEILAEDVLNNI